MSKTLLEKYAAAVRKRDKWAKRAEKLAAEAGIRIVRLAASTTSANNPRHPGPAVSELERPELQRGGKYFGALSQVARHLRVNTATVANVSCGASQSVRIAAAIRAEFARRDALPPPAAVVALTKEQRLEFRYGGRYYGVLAALAKRAHRSSSVYAKALHDPCRSRKAAAEICVEMARIDAELAAKAVRA